MIIKLVFYLVKDNMFPIEFVEQECLGNSIKNLNVENILFLSTQVLNSIDNLLLPKSPHSYVTLVEEERKVVSCDAI